MRNSLLFTPLIFCFFTFWQGSSIYSRELVSNETELSKINEAETSTISASFLSCSTPTGLYTSNITQSSATFNWTSVPGAQSYSVQTRLPNGTWYYAPGNPFYSTSVTVNGFNPGTTYQWRVRTNCSNGEYSYWSPGMYFTTGGGSSCEAPDYLATLNITQTTATWDWDSVSGAVSYSVQWRYAGGQWYNLQGGPWTNTHLNIVGLNPATTYEWRVKSNCPYGVMSPWSYAAIFTTLGSSCTMPTGLNTTNITETSATFSWSSVPGALNYSVQTRLPNGVWYFVPGSPFQGTSVTVNNLAPGTTYEWRVRANCSYGDQSPWTPGMVFTTGGSSSCNAPEGQVTLNITQTTATWDWLPASGAVSYSVQWRYAGGTWYNLSGGPWTNTILNVAGLQPGTNYEWRVRSNCPYGATSPWSIAASFTTLGNNCAMPVGLSITNITETSATFTWDPVPGAQSYSVQTRFPNGTWYYVSGSPTTNTSITVGGLFPGTTYEWRVRTNCSYNLHSNWTPGMSFTTDGSNACNAPVELNTYNITQTTATWDWSPVSGAVSYSVQWRYAGGTWYNLSGGPWTNTVLNIAGLQPATDYEWRVRSNCPYGVTSPWSAAAPFTTLGNTCATPAGLSTTNITDNTATFNWSAVSGAQSYSVQTRVPNGTWYYVAGSPTTNTSITVGGFTPNTTYEWRVRTNCAYMQHSNWSGAMSFTTSGSTAPANDNCSNATVLTVNSTCMNIVSSNIDATPSSPPPMGGCPSSNYKDVWFKFTMPNVNYPAVTIRTTSGSLANAVMEVYVGNSCAAMSYLACEDDNNNGNGSQMPVISVTGGPNITIWVRVWGYNGSTGTFSICVLDYQSMDFVDNKIEVTIAGDELEQSAIESVAEQPAIEIDNSPVLRISPNPASEVLHVTYGQTEESIVSGIVLVDMSGKIMVKKEYTSHDLVEFEEDLDVSTLTPGMYILQLFTSAGIKSEKVIIEH